jgi:sensor histidine kinase YesM
MERMEPVRSALVSTKKEEFEEITLRNIMKRLKRRNDFNRVIDSREEPNCSLLLLRNSVQV